MQILHQQQRAAVLLQTGNADEVSIEQQQEACRRYCQQQGYQLCEQHIYQDEGRSLCSDASPLVHLRMLVVQGQLDVLVIPRPGSLGLLPLWRSLQAARTIDEFYKYQVRIESVVARHGVHDVYQQMLLDAIHFVKQIIPGQIEQRQGGDDQSKKNQSEGQP